MSASSDSDVRVAAAHPPGDGHLPGPGVAAAQFAHHVAHMVPLCALFGLPLAVTNTRAQAAGAWYPDLDLRSWGGPDGAKTAREFARFFEEALRPYEILFVPWCLSRAAVEARSAELNWRPRTVLCPHGFSEKGSPPTSEAEQDIRLLYALTPRDGSPRRIVIGDLQRWYYDTHRDALDARLDRVMPRRTTNETIVLYTPTWVDGKQRCSAFDILADMAATVPPGYLLVVKPHPMLALDPVGLARVQQLVASRDRVVLLEDCPFTHPLLSRADVLLTDMSAIAYLFLWYRRPLILLDRNAGRDGDCSGSRLGRCATVVAPRDYAGLWRTVQQQCELFRAEPQRADAGTALYEAAYGSDLDVRRLAAEIAGACVGPRPA